jgi:hypothetical protein
LNAQEKQLLRETVGDTLPRWVVRTTTRVDTGRWTGRSPLWLCVMDDSLLLLAVGRRRYVQQVPLTECRGSQYNAARGGLIIAPAEELRFPFLGMTAFEALKTLDFIPSTPETTSRC